MKKFLIASYFVSMFLLTYVIVKATATHTGESVEVNFRKIEKELNQTEIAQHGWVPEDHIEYVHYTNLKETRTKKIFGWDTKIDTLSEGIVKVTHQH